VARPKEPLISKRDVVAAALEVIDTEGLEALSTRRLASILNVSGPALYHHFAGKDEIVAGAVALALDNVRLPPDSGGDWRDWLAAAQRPALPAGPPRPPQPLSRRRGRATAPRRCRPPRAGHPATGGAGRPRSRDAGNRRRPRGVRHRERPLRNFGWAARRRGINRAAPRAGHGAQPAWSETGGAIRRGVQGDDRRLRRDVPARSCRLTLEQRRTHI
jgi:AcrR family transcriptional regulator